MLWSLSDNFSHGCCILGQNMYTFIINNYLFKLSVIFVAWLSALCIKKRQYSILFVCFELPGDSKGDPEVADPFAVTDAKDTDFFEDDFCCSAGLDGSVLL